MVVSLKTLEILATIGVISILIWITILSNKLWNWIEKKGLWKGLKTLFKIDSEIYYEGQTKKETRYYLTSLAVGASELLNIARKNWSK